jgi:FAD/FMN-containing dehydrogenase
MASYVERKDRLLARLRSGRGSAAGLAKRTSSNRFRYQPTGPEIRRLDLSGFSHCVALDARAQTLEVEGLATFESIVDYTLTQGFVPHVTPELKHITIGGAIVGIGIESNSYRYGFVHDSLMEADVLLPGGEIVHCSPEGEHGELFRSLPNSYGTLGYILRAKIRVMPVKRFVHLTTTPYDDVDVFLEAMQAATERPDVDFVEGLFFDERRLFLVMSRFTDAVPRVDDILRHHVFYKLVLEQPDVYLTTKDYLFRYDPDWFWNFPEGVFYRMFRRYAPRSMRNSGFYKRYMEWKDALLERLPWEGQGNDEPLIQDWEVPWEEAAALTRFALREIDLGGRPWIVVGIRTPLTPMLYPIRAGVLYYNLGCYCQVKERPEKGPYWYTRILDRECFTRGGVKMLYSSHFLSREEFDRLYNGPHYRAIKARYDPRGLFGDVYGKTVLHLDTARTDMYSIVARADSDAAGAKASSREERPRRIP